MREQNEQRRRVAFVTGGSGAIGAELCRTLCKDGFCVGIGYAENSCAASALADELCASGGRALAVACDITDYNAVCAAKTTIEQVFGGADTVVNCAGSAAYTLFSLESAESIARTVEVDLLGAMYVCRAFTPDMVRERYGRIVNVASVCGMCGAAMETVYSAAKAGVIGFSKALAQELAPSGVTVNAVSPGFIDTPMNARFSDAERAAILEEIPACRFGTVRDVAAAVRFLVQADASYITGPNIAVTGGFRSV